MVAGSRQEVWSDEGCKQLQLLYQEVWRTATFRTPVGNDCYTSDEAQHPIPELANTKSGRIPVQASLYKQEDTKAS